MSGQPLPPEGLIEWSNKIGDWFTNEDSGILQISASQLRHEEPRQSLALTWLRWDADGRNYNVAESTPLEICGAREFHETTLALFSDASPEFTDVVLKVRFLEEEPGMGRLSTLFLEVDKLNRSFRVLNCR